MDRNQETRGVAYSCATALVLYASVDADRSTYASVDANEFVRLHFHSHSYTSIRVQCATTHDSANYASQHGWSHISYLPFTDWLSSSYYVDDVSVLSIWSVYNAHLHCNGVYEVEDSR